MGKCKLENVFHFVAIQQSSSEIVRETIETSYSQLEVLACCMVTGHTQIPVSRLLGVQVISHSEPPLQKLVLQNVDKSVQSN